MRFKTRKEKRKSGLKLNIQKSIGKKNFTIRTVWSLCNYTKKIFSHECDHARKYHISFANSLSLKFYYHIIITDSCWSVYTPETDTESQYLRMNMRKTLESRTHSFFYFHKTN